MPDLSEIWSSRPIGRPRKCLRELAGGFGPTGEVEYLCPALIHVGTSAPLKGRERSIGQRLCDIRHRSSGCIGSIWSRSDGWSTGQAYDRQSHYMSSAMTARPLRGHGKKNTSAPATLRKTCSNGSHPSHSTRSSTPNHRARRCKPRGK
jgi:hypothetical protein